MRFKAGLKMKISGKVKAGCDGFSITVGHDTEAVALHFNPRFNQRGDSNIIVCNSKQGGWGDEHRENCFPFQQGEEFKATTSDPAYFDWPLQVIETSRIVYIQEIDKEVFITFNRHLSSLL
ncbi:16 kDa beta-galactoside-binding lectin-like [Myxocyprinus asiaticus]|uniref:16 kDa beta-galactoside-binding lectin-like n=1 Tax=Myxocyprinus asiaticus TaxID=70543 RepID=UPI002222E4B7|nr:16 kDa beta-galactoside-binding lectin-like [Myxocyprinus asiaticus]